MCRHVSSPLQAQVVDANTASTDEQAAIFEQEVVGERISTQEGDILLLSLTSTKIIPLNAMLMHGYPKTKKVESI